MKSRGSAIWFAFGVASVGIVTGVLIGASQSPVAGVAATAGFGLFAAAFTVIQQVRQPRREHNIIEPNELRVDLGAVGQVLVLFALAFSAGVVMGAEIRASGWPQRPVTSIEPPWSAGTAPTDTALAVAWIEVQHRLLARGISAGQVRQLYEMSKKDPKVTPTQLLLMLPLPSDRATNPLYGGGLLVFEPKLAPQGET
jgi:hypothetical protein